MATKSILGLEIAGKYLKIACLKAAAIKKEIVAASGFSIIDLSDEQIAEKIQSFLEEADIKITGSLCAIATDSAITRNIEIPSVNPKEIKDIVGLQVGRHTPYPREEVIVDYINIGSFQKNYTKVLLVIVHRERVDQYVRLLSMLNVEADHIVFTPESLGIQIYKLEKQRVEDKPFGLLHLDKNFTEFIVSAGSKVIFTRNIPLGRQDFIGQAEAGHEKYLEEIKNSLEAYAGEDIGEGVSQILLTGSGRECPGLESFLAEELSLPVFSVAADKNLTISHGLDLEAENQKGIYFDSLFSSLSVAPDTELNLIPDEVRLKKDFQQKSKEIIKTGVLLLIAFMLIVTPLGIDVYLKENRLKQIDSRYQPLQKEVYELESIFSKVSSVRQYLKGRHYVLRLLEGVYAAIPDRMSFENIRYDPEGKVYIRGTAESMPAVFNFVSQMEANALFEEVKSERTTTREEGGRRVVDFRIEANLVNEEDM